jgi:hypothetical protein
MTAPGTPNAGSSPVAALYDGLRLSVLGRAAGVSLATNGTGPAFTVPLSQQAILVMVVIDGFTASKIDSGITLSYGFGNPIGNVISPLVARAYTELFSAAFGSIVGKGVSDVTIDNAGSGYSEATVAFTSNDLGRGATGHVVLDSDAIGSIVIDNPGYGYVVPPTVDITGDGMDAAATAMIGTATLLPSQPILIAQPFNLARISSGMSVGWSITNAVTGGGTCDITWLGALL